MSKKRSYQLITLLAFIALFLISCRSEQSNDNNGMMPERDMAIEEPAGDIEQGMGMDGAGSVGDLDLGEKVIETVNARYETVDFDASLEFINEQIEAHDAAVENSSRWQTSGNYRTPSQNISMTIRIPNERLDSFLGALSNYRGLVVQYEDIQRMDVTRTYRDNETRIEILREEEAVLREMLQEQGSLEEILLIRTRLSEVVTERELFENQNRDFDESIDYSSVYLEVIETNRANTRDGRNFWIRISDAFVDAFYSFIDVMQNLVITLVYLLPYLIILGILGLIVYAVVRSRRKRKK